MAADLVVTPVPRTDPHRRRLVLTLLLLTVALSAVVRFAALDTFPASVFDERYYAHDAVVLLHGELGPRGADTWRPGLARSLAHPELGTLAIAAGVALLDDGPWGRRLPSALAGTLLVALVYPLARRLFLPALWSLAAAMLAAADTMLIVESRLAVLDTFVALWSAACVYCALSAVQSRAFARWAVLCGLCGGLAVGSKWSGALAILAAVAVFAAYSRRSGGRRAAVAAAGVASLALAVYVASYAAYFVAGHSLADWVRLQRHMLGFNWDVQGTMAVASRPATWLLDVHPIWYEFREGPDGVSGLLAIGNPLLWWSAALALVVLGVLALARRDLRLGLAPLLVAVLYLPWLATSRQAFIYYMTPVVPFLAVLVASGLWRIAGRRPTACVPQALAWGGALLLAGGAFGLAGLGAGLLGSSHEALWRGAAVVAGAALAAAALVATLRFRQRRPALRAVAAWAYVGATAGLAVAYLPFLLGYPVLFDYYRHLTWFVTWR